MKVQYRIENEKPILKLQYGKTEWDALKHKFEQLKLKIGETHNGLGEELNTGKFYRSSKNEFSRSLGLSNVIDDINQKVMYHGYFNIGIFRFIPNDELVIEFDLGNFLTEEECARVKENIIRFFDRFVKFGNEWELERVTTAEEEQRLTEFINSLDVNLGGRNDNNS